MFRRLLLQDLYRVRGNMFARPHKVGLTSHIRNGNFVEVCGSLPGPPPVAVADGYSLLPWHGQVRDSPELWFAGAGDRRLDRRASYGGLRGKSAASRCREAPFVWPAWVALSGI